MCMCRWRLGLESVGYVTGVTSVWLHVCDINRLTRFFFLFRQLLPLIGLLWATMGEE